MTLNLIGLAFVNKARIDFTREDNPWAFSRIDEGLKESQRDRILVDPRQAPILLKSAPANNRETPAWMAEMEEILKTADTVSLQYKNGVLRFRRATHLYGGDKEFVTLGNQEEFDLYAQEYWRHIRYFYAVRRMKALCFDLNLLVSHKEPYTQKTQRIEIPARLDAHHPAGEINISFDSSGYNASREIVEWRGTVKEGEVGRYAPENSHIEFTVDQITRPFTFLHENRKEFHNHSFTFNGNNVRDQFKRLVKKRLRALSEGH
jgi:hypothetical protein